MTAAITNYANKVYTCAHNSCCDNANQYMDSLISYAYMQINVAEFITEINAAAFVIDCNPNLNGESVAKLTQPLVKYFRQKHPTTPIILAEGTTYGDTWLHGNTYSSQTAKRQALRHAYEQLVADGDKNLHYVYGDLLFGNSSSEVLINPTVGGTHPSDLGHHDIASYYLKFLPTVLGQG